MLDELKILNGVLSPKYDVNNNKYTVKITKDVNKLNISYPLKKEQEVHILGNNHLQVGNNYIVISIKENDEINYIYLNVIKEEDQSVFNMVNSDSMTSVENSMPIYGGPLIALSAILLIIMIFLFMFKRKVR